MDILESRYGWGCAVRGAFFSAALVTTHAANAQLSFSDNMAAGLDFTGFTYQPYQDGANAPVFVATEGVGGGDAVRTGVITQSTFSLSAETGFYVDFSGPGTLSFQWAVDGQPIVGGVGTLLQYNVFGISGTSGSAGSSFITGTTGFSLVTVPVPAGNWRFFVSYTRSAGSFGQGADAGWIDQLVWTPSGGPPDTTPDSFSFAAQTGVARSTVTPSNSVTVSGINAAADIAISSCTGTACQYAINSGLWTPSPGTVSNGDMVQVRQTSSANYASTTGLTLSIGGVSSTFNVTTEAAPAPDTTPDAFSFDTQSDVTISTTLPSNSITVSGIDAAADIAITGCTSAACEYAINGGTWTTTAGAVSNGDMVQVRQTSSPSYSTTTALTLEIGGVSAMFSATTEAAPPMPVPVIDAPTPTGSGTARAFIEASDSGAGCTVAAAQFLNAPVAPPEGVTLPHGLFAFTSSGCASGFSVDVTVEYPDTIPPGAVYWKYDADEGWFTVPASISGDTVTFTITDNGPGDFDPAAGTIADPGGIGFGSAAIPTLPQWATAVLAALMSLFAFASWRRRERMEN